jgi:hypothetical protein
MEGALHDKDLRDKLGIPKKVAEEFVNADRRKDNWEDVNQAAKKAAAGIMRVLCRSLNKGR